VHTRGAPSASRNGKRLEFRLADSQSVEAKKRVNLDVGRTKPLTGQRSQGSFSVCSQRSGTSRSIANTRVIAGFRDLHGLYSKSPLAAIFGVFAYKPPINQRPLRGRDVLIEDVLAKPQTALTVAESRDDPVDIPKAGSASSGKAARCRTSRLAARSGLIRSF
jgi:hypothetical protein